MGNGVVELMLIVVTQAQFSSGVSFHKIRRLRQSDATRSSILKETIAIRSCETEFGRCFSKVNAVGRCDRFVL